MLWGLSLDQLFLWSKHKPTQPLIDSSSIHYWITLLRSFFLSLSFSLSHLEKWFYLIILPSLMCAYCLTNTSTHINMYISYWWLNTLNELWCLLHFEKLIDKNKCTSHPRPSYSYDDVRSGVRVRVSGTKCLDPLSLIEVVQSKMNILSLFDHPHVLTNLGCCPYVPQIKCIVLNMGFEQHEGDLIMREYSFSFHLCMLMDVCYSL